MSLKIIVTKGSPGSGKSYWSKQEISKDPLNWLRINNDQIRDMLNNSEWSKEYETIITETRKFLIREGLKKNKNLILDNVNAGNHFQDICDIAASMNKDIIVSEKAFYQPLEILLERDSKREGKARVGDKVVKKWFKELGGVEFEFYKEKTQVFNKNVINNFTPQIKKEVVNGNPQAIIVDLDGSVSLFNKIGKDGVEVIYPEAHARDPYDASNADNDMLNEAVATVIRQSYASNTKIIFCSGRQDIYKPQTERFLNKHFPNMKYLLFMRKSKDFRKDAIIKEEIYNSYIKDKFQVSFILDDRKIVVDKWREIGLVCFQVAPGDF